MPGRNEPCPCGSGKKYKKCHLAADEARIRPVEEPEDEGVSLAHARDNRLIAAAFELASNRNPSQWKKLVADELARSPDPSPELYMPYLVCHARLSGRTPLELYLETRGRFLDAQDSEWLEAQQHGWMSIWEVTGVDPGKSVDLRDRINGAKRTAWEVAGSRTMRRGHGLLLRIVDWHGTSLICGMHPKALRPDIASDVVKRARRELGLRRSTELARLREHAVTGALIDLWEEAVEESEAAARRPPIVTNRDGDPLVLTTDEFTFAAVHRQEIVRRLGALPGVLVADANANETIVVFHERGTRRRKEWDETTLIGTAGIGGSEMRLETNSTRRANALRKRVETALGALVARGRRSAIGAQDVFASTGGPEELVAPSDEAPDPEAEAVARKFKERHCERWPDEPVPALGGKTPREAAQTPSSRRKLRALLGEMEFREEGLPPSERYDFTILYRVLGLRRT